MGSANCKSCSSTKTIVINEDNGNYFSCVNKKVSLKKKYQQPQIRFTKRWISVD